MHSRNTLKSILLNACKKIMTSDFFLLLVHIGYVCTTSDELMTSKICIQRMTDVTMRPLWRHYDVSKLLNQNFERQHWISIRGVRDYARDFWNQVNSLMAQWQKSFILCRNQWKSANQIWTLDQIDISELGRMYLVKKLVQQEVWDRETTSRLGPSVDFVMTSHVERKQKEQWVQVNEQ